MQIIGGHHASEAMQQPRSQALSSMRNAGTRLAMQLFKGAWLTLTLLSKHSTLGFACEFPYVRRS